MFTLIVLITLIAIHALIVMLAGLYTIVPADCADVVIQKGRMRVFSPHREYNPTGKSAYFEIPSWFFMFGLGMTVHRIPLRILAIDVPDFLSFDKDRARFLCDIIAYIAIKDPVDAAIGVSNQGAMTSILNRLARPNDLGFSEFGGIVEGVKDAKATKNAKDAKDQKT